MKSNAICWMPPAADHASAANEIESLPEGTVIVKMLGDYAVLGNQAKFRNTR
ncbi:hypothetical protein [Pseudotabrizicola formosa]|uniref:hypothetical protein n=1 Tax=Pseudotabrizicola formosa TaxID=2030009 RepID=UPI00143DDB0C|nr:hypothetical protein [Pseudotabrizicola formosa]